MEGHGRIATGTDAGMSRNSLSGAQSSLQAHMEDNDRTPLLRDSRSPIDDTGVPGAESKKTWRSANIFWLLPFLLLFMLGLGGTVVPKINLILTLVCRDYLADKASKDPNFTYIPVVLGEQNEQCRIPEVQSIVARFQLYLNLIAGVLSALASPRLGHLSDLYGRTKIIALGTLGAVLSEMIVVIVAAKSESAPVNLLLLGAFLDGLGGSYTTGVALVTSYASDCTRPESRNMAFGYFHGFLFAGTAAGPRIASIFLERGGRVLDVFIIALVLQTLYLLAVCFVVPESMPLVQQKIAREKHRMKEQEHTSWLARWNPLTLLAPLKILAPPVGRPSSLFPNPGGSSQALRRNIIILASMDMAVFGVAMGTAQIVIIYAEYMFGWGNVESGKFLFIINITRVAHILIILPLVTRIFRKPSTVEHSIPGCDKLDVSLIRLSVLFDIVGYTGYALSRSGAVMTFSGILSALGGMGPPVLQSSLTKHVPRDRIGQILGATGLLHALVRIAAPAFFSLIYSLTIGKFPQTVFVCLTGVFGIALICGFFIRPHGLHPPSRPSFICGIANMILVRLDLDDGQPNRCPETYRDRENGETEDDALLRT